MRSLSKGISARGRNELKRHLEGGKLTFKQAILAKCYDCMGFYVDGKADCAIPECPLYPVMPYRKTSTVLETPKNGVSGTERVR
jgi:hypothetical protein